MTRNPSLRNQVVVLIAAWLNAVPAFYLLYDYWMRGIDSSFARRELLRPYAFFVGICPLLLFWAGCVYATIGTANVVRHNAALVTPRGERVLALGVLVLAALGSLIGTAAGLPTLAVTALGLGRGDVPLGLLALLGALAAGAIWLLGCLLRRLDRAAV